jgi:glycosyltransferase involved in cell wall biosynthesis
MKVFHFYNGNGGGVLSVIRNLISYKQNTEIENHIIHVINKDLKPDYKIIELSGATTEKIFFYSSKWNFYFTSKQLAKYIPDNEVLIIAHDWIELGMISNLGLQIPLVYILHGDFDYYYKLSKLHSRNIDLHICVSNIIRTKLTEVYNINGIVQYLRFPVPYTSFDCKQKFNSNLICSFYVRDLSEARKNFLFLPKIDAELKKRGIQISWNIAGGGMSYEIFKQKWGEEFNERIKFWGELTRQEVNLMLSKSNIFILPSNEEGFPVSLVESMKYGLVPIVPNWGGAINELVIDGKNGYICQENCISEYVESLNYLNNNIHLLKSMSLVAQEYANKLFNPIENTLAYEYAFNTAFQNKKNKIKFKAYGSNLDRIWLNNKVVVASRFLINFISKSAIKFTKNNNN